MCLHYMQKDHIHMLKIQQSMLLLLEFSDYGNIKITQHALKVSVFTLLKFGTTDYKEEEEEEVANHYIWRGWVRLRLYSDNPLFFFFMLRAHHQIQMLVILAPRLLVGGLP